MVAKEAYLEAVSKYGGIKLHDNKEKWLNPTKEQKEAIQNKLEEIKKWQGKKVIVEMSGDSNFTGIGPAEHEPEKKQNLGKDHIINLQGKEYVTHEGLLELGHKKGLKSIESFLMSSPDAEQIIFKARITMDDNKFYEAFGDADNSNVNKNISIHKIRMAETRAINRALRFAVNVGMCSADELGGPEKQESQGNVETEDVQEEGYK